jgi:hypothetical protein
MTARISLFAAVIAVFIFSCDTERNIAPVFESYFTKYYGEDGNQYGVDLAVGSDGTLVMLGRSESQTNAAIRSFIVKTDGNGVVLWERQLGGNNEEPVDVEIDSRNDILVVSNITGDSIRITRITQSGDELGNTIIAYKDKEGNVIPVVGTAVTETSDGSLLLTGYAGPDLVSDGTMPPTDVQDLLIYRVDPNFVELPEMLVTQGGEHIGKIVKIFESQQAGPVHYYRFGDSDRPFNQDGAYRQAFEVAILDEFFLAKPTVPGPAGENQISREAIEMPVIGEGGYLLVGSSGQEPYKQILISQYIDSSPKLSMRFSKVIPTPRSAEGISVAYGEQDSMFVLADEKQDNNNHDIYLVKLDSEGKWLGETRFGSIEGDDRAAAVRVLPDQRVAVFGTIELVTQKKMMLTLVSPQGTFSE